MSVLKSLVTFIAILISQIFALEWIQDGNHFISSERLILKFQNPPELGIEPPLKLKSRINIQKIISNYGDAILEPTFSNYNEFTPHHRNHNYILLHFLHMKLDYYILSLNLDIGHHLDTIHRHRNLSKAKA